jgi:hypothetical protein
MPTKVRADILAAAIEGFEAQKKRINVQIAELRAMLAGGPAQPVVAPAGAPTKRKVSAAARRRMALAQKARWARLRGESKQAAPATPEPTSPKRRISEEGMKRIIAATKRRWRLAKAAKAQATAAKKTAPAQKRTVVRKALKAPKKTTRRSAAVKGTAKATPAPTPVATNASGE